MNPTDRTGQIVGDAPSLVVDFMYGGEGDDIYYADQSNDIVFEGQAGWGTDRVYASASFTLGNNIDELFLEGIDDIDAAGNNQNNVLFGNTGANAISGRDGDDAINGGGGDDTLSGGAGDDMFVFGLGSGHDIVTDFAAGGAEDELSLSGYNGAGVTWEITQAGADALFSFSNGDTITLVNVNMADLVYDGLFGYS